LMALAFFLDSKAARCFNRNVTREKLPRRN
jgi:hypothetical protein